MYFEFNDKEKLIPGTKVEYIGNLKTIPLKRGERGTVVNYNYGEDTIGVNWDKAGCYRHSCGGECHPDHGYVVKKRWLIKCTEE